MLVLPQPESVPLVSRQKVPVGSSRYPLHRGINLLNFPVFAFLRSSKTSHAASSALHAASAHPPWWPDREATAAGTFDRIQAGLESLLHCPRLHPIRAQHLSCGRVVA